MTTLSALRLHLGQEAPRPATPTSATLICTWTIDPRTGRPTASWTAQDQRLA